ncbi:SURF1 family cytochrome oxidase biogenesis protein [Corynebacterium pseudodiphtheriticum]|uniref:SURF1-like protein n=1 Tax=Corynebacterium pseudodiphtheriticum TaxID=37637 RepID=A0ABT7FYD6_9CORY|nr:SURF1 family cytochrome oxidase biogenesis protein [Corynebacterium pseudodiphtheriticum]MDK4291005.1 SURF1 family cytochrome oxidase biogenesis protein [Corynebacterium pseudodiphtheriticum]MDK4321236.1 SURF1 family cytochrome oxidase biogenesis protein [Corynebacterium pseudodiphtheriticum]
MSARSQQPEQSEQPKQPRNTDVPQTNRTAHNGAPTSWWKVFAKPSWIILALSLIAFSILAFTVLAPWQLNKDDEIVDRNERIQQAYEQDPVPFAELVDASGGITIDEEWHRVILRGHYLPEHEMLLRLRPLEGSQVFQSLVPFQLDSGQTVLVNRGFAVANRDGSVPEITPPSGTHITTEAMLRFGEAPHEAPPIDDAGYTQVRSVSPEQVEELTGLELADAIVNVTAAEQPEALEPIPVPKLDRGSHLSYGFQWIAFGIMAPAGLAYFVYAELRERRRERAEHATEGQAQIADDEQPDADETSAQANSPAGASAPAASARPAAATRSRGLQDRYGGDSANQLAKFRGRRRR